MKIKSIFSLRKWIGLFLSLNIAKKISDETYLSLKYYVLVGKKLNLSNPQTFNEKLQWLKLYNCRPEYTVMADKYAVRKHIAETIGEEYLIPLLGRWDSPEDIDFDALPNQFVLKCNHNSGLGMCICKDKSSLDIEKVKSELAKGLNQNYFLSGREWCYKNIKPCIVAEKYMEDSKSSELRDYKFFCFNGIPKIMYISNDIANTPTTDFYDETGFLLKMRMRDPNSSHIRSLPHNFEKMKILAKTLSTDICHVRVDFYECNNEVFIGELTFFHCSGFSIITPEEWNYILGSWITLPPKFSQ